MNITTRNKDAIIQRTCAMTHCHARLRSHDRREDGGNASDLMARRSCWREHQRVGSAIRRTAHLVPPALNRRTRHSEPSPGSPHTSATGASAARAASPEAVGNRRFALFKFNFFPWRVEPCFVARTPDRPSSKCFLDRFRPGSRLPTAHEITSDARFVAAYGPSQPRWLCTVERSLTIATVRPSVDLATAGQQDVVPDSHSVR